ncbi:MAG TPA: hypothetical protein VFY65_06110 [Longimicrobium sp.]|nr:hypothetical protein [Longimicrobium sp.]
MKLDIGHAGVKAVAFGAVLLASATVSARVVAHFAGPPPPAESPFAGVYTDEKLEAATQRFTGRVSGPVQRLLAADTTLAVVLRARDLTSCEDLGRQLRNLRRVAPARTLVVWTEPKETEDVRRFLRRERVSNVAVSGMDLSTLMVDVRALVTPAAMLVSPDGQVVQGIAHPSRFPNMRLRSFAEELTVLGTQGTR